MTSANTAALSPEPVSIAGSNDVIAPAAVYEAPAILHRGKLELRAGSPLALPEFTDPNNPFP